MQGRAKDILKTFHLGNNNLAGILERNLTRTTAACYLSGPRSIVPYIRNEHPPLPELAEEVRTALTLKNIGTLGPVSAGHTIVFLSIAQPYVRNVEAWQRKLAGPWAEKLALQLLPAPAAQ